VRDPKKQAITQRLANLAKQQGVQYQFVLTTFLIQQLLLRLTQNRKLSRHLVFKGGFVMLRAYDSPRYTVDLDASLTGIAVEDVSPLIIKAAQESGDGVTWYIFQKTIDLEAQGEYGGIRFIFRAGLGEVLKDVSKAQVIHLDLGIGDVVSGEAREVPLLLSEDECRCSVYPCEVIVAEKLHSLITRAVGNSRSKDVFDIAHLAERISIKELQRALTDTFKTRGDQLPTNLYSALQSIDTLVLRRGWASAVASVGNSRSFDDAVAAVLELVRRL
jgi:predicted nucleotidyltransferase component of viral defense system